MIELGSPSRYQLLFDWFSARPHLVASARDVHRALPELCDLSVVSVVLGQCARELQVSEAAETRALSVPAPFGTASYERLVEIRQKQGRGRGARTRTKGRAYLGGIGAGRD